jgi:hypothetical protein
MEHRLIGLDDPGGWTEALVGLRHPAAHTHSHVRAFARSSVDETVLYVAADADGATAVACPLSIRGDEGERDVYSPYGFGGFASDRDRPEFADEWDAFASAQGWIASYVVQHPELTADLGFAPASSISCFVLDLAPSEEDLVAAMSRSRRQELRSWARRAPDLTEDRDEVLSFLLEFADDFFAEREAAAVYRFDPVTWTDLVGSAVVRVVGVREEGRVVAANVTAEHDGLADSLFLVCRPGAGGHSSPLVWEAARRCRTAGARSLNLGGGVRPDDQIAEIKRRFGATPRPATVHRCVHRGEAYAELCRRTGVSVSTDGFFPPYRRRSA